MGSSSSSAAADNYQPTKAERYVWFKLQRRTKKATCKDKWCPKPKHINKIIDYLNADSSLFLIKLCIKLLIERIIDGGKKMSLNVMWKALIVLHNLLQWVPQFASQFGKQCQQVTNQLKKENRPISKPQDEIKSKYFHYLKMKALFHYNSSKQTNDSKDPSWIAHQQHILIVCIIRFEMLFHSFAKEYSESLLAVQALALVSRDLAPLWSEYRKHVLKIVAPNVYKATTVEQCQAGIKQYSAYLDRADEIRKCNATVLEYTDEKMDDVANLNNVIDDLLPSMILHLEHLRKRQQQQTEKIPAAPDCNPSPTAQQQQSPCAPAAHEDDVLLIDFS